MEDSLSGESSVSGFNETNGMETEEFDDESGIVISTSPSEPEKLFVEAVRKLNSYEHSLESLVKRFDKDGMPTRSLTRRSERSQRSRNFDVLGTNTSIRTDRSAGGDRLVPRTGHQATDDRQKFVEIQIPFRTAEIILRILNEDLDKNHRSALRQAEFFLRGAKENLVAVKEHLRRHLENGNKSQEPILAETNQIADDMFTVIDNLGEKLVECEVQNLSELLVTSMNDETRLATLGKGPTEMSGEETTGTMALCAGVISGTRTRSIVFHTIVCCIISSFVVRLMLHYLVRAHLLMLEPFQEHIQQMFSYLRRAVNWLIGITFAMFK